jgi:hypothetical protein
MIAKNDAYTKVAAMMVAVGINRAANPELNATYANRICCAAEGDQTDTLTAIAEDLARRTCNEQNVDFGDGRGVVLHKMPDNLPSFAAVRRAALDAAGIR